MRRLLGKLTAEPAQGGMVRVCAHMDGVEWSRAISAADAMHLAASLSDCACAAQRPAETPDTRLCAECVTPIDCERLGCQVRRGPEDKG